MIVHCPSCSTGFHLAAPSPATMLRCSRCREAFPCPTHRRSYVLGQPAAAAMSGPASIRFASKTPGTPGTPVPEPAIPRVATPPMAALDEALFAPQPVRPAGEGTPLVPGPAARRRQARKETRTAGGGLRVRLVPLALTGAGAAAGWLATPRLTDPAGPLGVWFAALPFAVEPWMVGAAGAAAGLLLGGVWLAWRAART